MACWTGGSSPMCFHFCGALIRPTLQNLVNTAPRLAALLVRWQMPRRGACWLSCDHEAGLLIGICATMVELPDLYELTMAAGYFRGNPAKAMRKAATFELKRHPPPPAEPQLCPGRRPPADRRLPPQPQLHPRRNRLPAKPAAVPQRLAALLGVSPPLPFHGRPLRGSGGNAALRPASRLL